MKRGAAHVRGLYTYPAGSGTQLADGCDVVWDLGLRTIKLYLTGEYVDDYPLQTSWSSTPTNLTELAQTDEMLEQLSRSWNTVVLTVLTFANGPTNWWRADVSASRLAAEYSEIRTFVEWWLTTFNGTARTLVIQTWEGDWAFMDSFSPDTYVPETMIRRYAAFLGTRQRAVEDARRAVASDCKVLNALEVNRVLDARLYSHRRRIVRDLAGRVSPDVVSLSAYDGTIVDQGGWGANHAAWLAATVPAFTRELRVIKKAFPRARLQIGEFGFPEGAEKPPTADIAAMIEAVDSVAAAEGCDRLLFWQALDNEQGGGGPGTYRGYWLIQPDGSSTLSSVKLAALGGG